MNRASLILILLGLTSKTSASQCMSNSQCQDELNDPEACCLYLERKKDHTGYYECASGTKKDYYLKSRDYNKHMRMWMNPKDHSEHYQVYCKENRDNKYPYVQPYADLHDILSPRKDPTNKNVYSDMFFKPKQVTNIWLQLEKLWNAFFWGIMTVPFWILYWNANMFLLDLLILKAPPGTYPSMYNNFLTAWVMQDEWWLEWIWPGIFKYYDMFTVEGWNDWFWDFLSTVSGFWVIQVIGRLMNQDWDLWAPENNNDINMNRLIPVEDDFDPYDFTAFMDKEGPDCNKNMGVGNYCYCEQEGFHCNCKYNHDFGTNTIRTCYDYFGYDCEGNYVDGESHWCQEQGNTFTYLNDQKKKQNQ